MVTDTTDSNHTGDQTDIRQLFQYREPTQGVSNSPVIRQQLTAVKPGRSEIDNQVLTGGEGGQQRVAEQEKGQRPDPDCDKCAFDIRKQLISGLTQPLTSCRTTVGATLRVPSRSWLRTFPVDLLDRSAPQISSSSWR